MKRSAIAPKKQLNLPLLGTPTVVAGDEQKELTVALVESDTPREAGGLMSWAASKAVGQWV